MKPIYIVVPKEKVRKSRKQLPSNLVVTKIHKPKKERVHKKFLTYRSPDEIDVLDDCYYE